MVGLSIVLESHKSTTNTTTNKNHHQKLVINKATTIVMIKPSAPPPPPPSLHRELWNPPPSRTAAGFLDRCFLCQQKLLPGRDIYMYKGDRAFCSVECRCRQMFMDEEESINSLYKRDNCSLAAIKIPELPSSSSSSSPPPSSRNRKGPTRKRANGFAY